MSDEGRTLQMIYQLAQTVDQILRHVRRIEQIVNNIKKNALITKRKPRKTASKQSHRRR
jgi:hypothetical protein